MMKTCFKYRQTLWLDVYGELDPEKRSSWEKHLDSCEDCQKEKEKLVRTIKTVKTADTTPELSIDRADAMAKSITLRLKEEKESRGWRNWLPERHVRLIPVMAAASIILVAVGWFNLSDLNLFSPVHTAAPITPEERQMINDLELIKNLELLKEMEALQKLVQMIDQPASGIPGYGENTNLLKKNNRRLRRHAQYSA